MPYPRRIPPPPFKFNYALTRNITASTILVSGLCGYALWNIKVPSFIKEQLKDKRDPDVIVRDASKREQMTSTGFNHQSWFDLLYTPERPERGSMTTEPYPKFLKDSRMTYSLHQTEKDITKKKKNRLIFQDDLKEKLISKKEPTQGAGKDYLSSREDQSPNKPQSGPSGEETTVAEDKRKT